MHSIIPRMLANGNCGYPPFFADGGVPGIFFAFLIRHFGSCFSFRIALVETDPMGFLGSGLDLFLLAYPAPAGN